MQITGQKPTWFDGDGNPLVAGKVFFYETGTSTPIGIFSDADLSAPADNPVILDSRGQPSTAIFVADGAVFDVYVYDADDVLQESALQITAPLSTGTTPFATTTQTIAGVSSITAVTPAGGAAAYDRLSVAAAHTAGKSTARVVVPVVAGIATIDLALSNVFGIGAGTPPVIAENVTIANPTNPLSGQSFVIFIREDATGGRTVAFDTKFWFVDGVAAINTGANVRNKVVCTYSADEDRYYCEIGPNYTA